MISLRELEKQSGISYRKLYELAKRKYPARFCKGLRAFLTDEEGQSVVEERRRYETEPSSKNKIWKNRIF